LYAIIVSRIELRKKVMKKIWIDDYRVLAAMLVVVLSPFWIPAMCGLV
jgi:hypothetical protein|tara:strand:- start:60 stop:203 length:144 start_codon:yes stop_codon:yes gene_type:complete